MKVFPGSPKTDATLVRYLKFHLSLLHTKGPNFSSRIFLPASRLHPETLNLVHYV